ncbi:MAG: alpha-galactosidase [Proteobacteria bacterium]|nr:alpha-galactosidase [Pseudomonadota bacterium]
MSSPSTTRRQFLQLAAGAGMAPGALGGLALAATEGGNPDPAPGTAAPHELADAVLQLRFDQQLRSRLAHWRGGTAYPLTPWMASEWLELEGGARITLFSVDRDQHEPLEGPRGRGERLTISGVGVSQDQPTAGAAARLRKTLRAELYERHPGLVFFQVEYRNVSDSPVALRAWRSADLELPGSDAPAQGDTTAEPTAREETRFWSYCGSTHADRRDWVQPVHVGFDQDNYLGMTASDYGGGIPVVDVWQRDCGVALGHLETHPRLLSLPVRRTGRGVRMAIAGKVTGKLAPGESFSTPQTFMAVHTGDYFAALDAYRRVMAEQGLCPAPPPQAAYEPIWCSWGYERSCTVALIEGTLPKVRDLGLRWAVVDDGWQTNVGDWRPAPDKYPRGDADMRALTDHIRAGSLKPRLWVAPLAAAPGSDLLHDHTDMLLLDADGAPQLISWWNSFYLCPAYAKTVAYHEELVRRILGTWGYAGLKIDGQHLNGVAPCYNPAHRHARPEESLEGLQDFFQALYRVAMRIDPQAVMELCPCGTGFSFFDFSSVNQVPASDPESSWQVRLKGKTLKALMGGAAPFAGDHVELSDGGDDFASTVGIGAVVSTKFTWPRDPKPRDSFLLTPQREALWRKWIGLYNERMLPQGNYRGELYDIGFDKPEGHVVEKSGRLYYAFYARHWHGPIALRGLKSGVRYRLRDYFNGRDFGHVTSSAAPMPFTFQRFLVLEALPV